MPLCILRQSVWIAFFCGWRLTSAGLGWEVVGGVDDLSADLETVVFVFGGVDVDGVIEAVVADEAYAFGEELGTLNE